MSRWTTIVGVALALGTAGLAVADGHPLAAQQAPARVLPAPPAPVPSSPATPVTGRTPPLPAAPPAAPVGVPPAPPVAANRAVLTIRYADYGPLQEVDGETLYRAAREALNRDEYRRAASLFAQLRRDHPASVVVGDSYYYQAFALYRAGQRERGEADARAAYAEAAALLQAQATRHATASTRRDAEALRVRVESAMASRGDTAARATVAARAQEACRSEEDGVRAMALSALINMDSERAVPILRDVVADRGACLGELRAQAIFLLAQHEPDGIVDLLMDIVENDPDPEVREAAVFWLADTERPEALDALLRIVDTSEDEDMVNGAVFALSRQNDPRAGEALMRLIRRSDAPADSRGAALFWLAENADAQVPLMRDLYRELNEPELRAQIMFAVGRLESPEATDFLREVALDSTVDSEVRGQAIFFLGQRGAGLTEFRSIYGSVADRELKEQVLFGVSRMGTREAVDFLMQVARTDPDSELREQAVFFLGQTDDPRVPAFLLEIIGR